MRSWRLQASRERKYTLGEVPHFYEQARFPGHWFAAGVGYSAAAYLAAPKDNPEPLLGYP